MVGGMAGVAVGGRVSLFTRQTPQIDDNPPAHGAITMYHGVWRVDQLTTPPRPSPQPSPTHPPGRPPAPDHPPSHPPEPPSEPHVSETHDNEPPKCLAAKSSGVRPITSATFGSARRSSNASWVRQLF